MRSQAIRFLESFSPVTPAHDAALDTFIRDWRGLPPRPVDREPYLGIIVGAGPKDGRARAIAYLKHVTEALKRLECNQTSSTVCDEYVDRFIRAVQNLPPRPDRQAPYVNLFPAQSVPILPSFEGGTPIETQRAIARECRRYGLRDAPIAYVLATTQWETAETWQPVREAFWLTEEERKRELARYYPYYGRGYVQLTWKENYAKYAKITGLPLVEQPDLAMRPDVSLFILCHGMVYGNFTGLALSDFFTDAKADFRNARKIINGLDKAAVIEAIARHWLTRIPER